MKKTSTQRILKSTALALLFVPSVYTMADDYVANLNGGATISRSDRVTSQILLIDATSNEQTIITGHTSASRPVYNNLNASFSAKSGMSYSPKFVFGGGWMHGYAFIDFDRDGSFSNELGSNGVPSEGSELVSYNLYNGKNSLGESVTMSNPTEGSNPLLSSPLPAFTIPTTTKPGIYKMRYKIDWANIDPAGSDDLATNGGVIFDVNLNVHNDEVNVKTISNDKGEILALDNSNINGTNVAFGQELKIKAVANEGYRCSGLSIRHGYMDGEESIHGVNQWQTITVPAFAMESDGTYTIPAQNIDGDIEITANFVEKTNSSLTNYDVNFDASTLQNTNASGRHLVSFALNNGSSSQTFTMPTETPIMVFYDKTDAKAFTLKSETLTPQVDYSTTGPMDGYFYIDYNNDGSFDVEIGSDNKPTAGSELVSYSRLNGFNSEGVAATPSANISFPSFKLPEVLSDGVYRARLKIDWNNSDPGGRAGDGYDSNFINDNGGAIVDFLISVSSTSEATLNIETEHGNIYAPNNKTLPMQITKGQTIDIVPSPVKPGYKLKTLYVKHGMQLNGEQIVNGSTFWKVDTLETEGMENQTITIPASMTDGDVIISAKFENESSLYKMIFNDEFNTSERTPASSDKWGHCTRYSSTWNRYLSDSDDVQFQENGNLVLRAIPNPDTTTDPVPMLTGGLKTQGKFAFTHGYIECRAKCNPFVGNFPAIWLMPEDGSDGWPGAGEIDIFEQINTGTTAYHTIHSHWANTLGNTGNPNKSGTYNLGDDVSEYHVYGLERTAEELIWYVDGKRTFSYANMHFDEESKQWPFEKDFYIILNQSVGDGSWASSPNTSHTYEFLVDWVRVYRDDFSEKYTEAETEAARLIGLTDVVGYYSSADIASLTEAYNKFEETKNDANGEALNEELEAMKGKETIQLDIEKNYFKLKGSTNGKMFYDDDSSIKPSATGSEESAVWEFEPSDEDGSYYIRNVNTNRYIQNYTLWSAMRTGENKVAYQLDANSNGTGFFTLKNPKSEITSGSVKCQYLYNDVANNRMVLWEESPNTYWYLVNVPSKPTMIESVDANNKQNDETYDLGGRKTKAQTKGIVIKNRKIVRQ